MAIDLTVVIPGFNEAGNIGRVAGEAFETLTHNGYKSFEILLVNDGSSDATRQVIEDLATQRPEFRAISHERNRGMGGAIRTGFSNAAGEVVTWIPGDGQFELTQILAGVPLLRDKDLILVRRGDRNDAARGVISFFFHATIRIFFGFDARDLCGIYLMRQADYAAIQPKSDHVFINLEIPLLFLRRGKRLGYIDAEVKPRLSGVSKVANVRTMARTIKELVKFRLGL